MTILLLVLSLIGGFALAAAAAPSAARAELAFVGVDHGLPQLFVIGADGTERRQLTSGSGSNTTPVWSPDGRRIAFIHRDGNDSQVYLMNADGTSQRRLTTDPGSHASPAWSPDGREVIFVATRDGESQIVAVSDTGTRRDLTRPPGERRNPAWSPDGRLIAFQSKAGSGPFDLFVMGADGTNLRQVPTPSFGLQPDVTSFAWLPDGRLAYTNRSGTAQESLAVTNVDGTGQRFLGTASSPAWSPDGGRLAFVLSRVGGAQIDVRDSAGGTPVRLTDPLVISVRPTWSPDGRQIAFLIIDGGTVTLTVMDADGSHKRGLGSVYGDLSARPVFSWRPR